MNNTTPVTITLVPPFDKESTFGVKRACTVMGTFPGEATMYCTNLNKNNENTRTAYQHRRRIIRTSILQNIYNYIVDGGWYLQKKYMLFFLYGFTSNIVPIGYSGMEHALD